jgi:MoaA/NifB/PqqE/SkfB family radical SAM enzyme
MSKFLSQLRYAKNLRQVYRYFFSPIKSIELAITYNCNYSCRGCYAGDLREQIMMPPEQVKELVAKYRPMHINITGGEPLLHFHWYEIIKDMPKSVVVSMVTNGSLVSKITIGNLKRAGLNTLQISYGTNYNKRHNIRIAEWASRAGINVCLSVTNTFENRGYIIDAIRQAAANNWHVLFNLPSGELEKEFDKETYLKYRDDPVVREDNMFWAGAGRCPAGTKKIYITAKGELMPCDRIHTIYPSYEAMREVYKDNKAYCSRLGDIHA